MQLVRTAFFALLFLTTEIGIAQVAVLTYHNDNTRAGQNVQESVLTPSNVNSTTFGKLGSLSVQGLVDAQPLYAPNVNINGTLHNVVYVVTEHDMVYGFDADTLSQLWAVTVVGTGETPSDDRGCNAVTPEIGITATPVIDRQAGAHGMIYLVAASKDSSGGYHHRIHALDLANGTESGGPTEIQATYRSATATLTFDSAQYLQRAALLLLNGIVYVTFASHCDNPPYNGWILGYSQTSLQQATVFQMTPNGSEGAIWMSGGGLAADSEGNIYFLDGNGTFDTTLNAGGFPVNGDFGNSFMKLSTAGNTLAAADYFVMSNVAAENAGDLDLGSGGAILLPDLKDNTGTTHQLAVGAGKDLNIYVVDRNSMGKFNPNTNNIYQEIPAGTGLISGTEGVFATPAYFNNTVYYGAVDDALKAFSISNAKLVAPAGSQTAITYGYPGVTPSVSASGSSNGIVWAVQNGIPGILHAYSASNLTTELYNSSQAGTRDQFQNSKFNAPMIANGRVFINGTTGVTVFGLLSSLTAQSPTAALSVSPTSGSAPLTVNASTAGSSDPNTGGSIVASWIDFGDGTLVNATSSSHQYTSPGTYTVVGTVYDNFGKSARQTATVTVSVAVTSPPSITKSFGASSIALNGSTSLTFNISNPNSGTSLNGVAFTDALPSGLVVSTPNGLTGSCGGGTITAAAGASSISLSGAALTPSASCSFSVNVTATTAGTKNNSVQVSSTNGGTGNTSNASLTVQSLSPVSVSPSSGTGALQTFAFTFSDASGYTDITTTQQQFSTGGAGSYVSNCSTAYDRTNNQLYLQNDNGSGWLGPVTVGSGGSLSNSQCTIDPGASSATGSGTTLTLNMAVQFSSTLATATNVFGWVQNASSQNSGWVQLGTWNTATTLRPGEVSPTGGTGSSLTFAFNYSDPNGYTDITTAQAQFTSSSAGSYIGNCSLAYDRANNQLYLQTDTGSGWQGPVNLGSAGTLSNSQCTIDLGGSSASGSGNILTLNLAVTFSGSFTGTKTIYGWVQNGSSQNSGWQQMGTWTTTAVLAAPQVSPSSGSGSAQTFTFTYTDPNGYTDITTTQAMFGTTAGAYVNDCATAYDRVHNQLYLQNDTGSGWQGPATVGTAGTLTNSQCTIDVGSSSASGSGNILQVSLAVAFSSSFTGTKSVFSWVQNASSQTAGWTQVGSWSTATILTATKVTPNSGNATTQTFAFQYTDPNGYTDITTAQAMFGFTPTSYVGVCATAYIRGSNQLYLQNDSGSGWLGPMTLGTSNTLSNSQCSISGTGSSATGSGVTLTLNLAVTFGAGLNPSAWQSTANKSIFGWVQNASSQNSGWKQLGSWVH